MPCWISHRLTTGCDLDKLPPSDKPRALQPLSVETSRPVCPRTHLAPSYQDRRLETPQFPLSPLSPALALPARPASDSIGSQYSAAVSYIRPDDFRFLPRTPPHKLALVPPNLHNLGLVLSRTLAENTVTYDTIRYNLQCPSRYLNIFDLRHYQHLHGETRAVDQGLHMTRVSLCGN